MMISNERSPGRGLPAQQAHAVDCTTRGNRCANRWAAAAALEPLRGGHHHPAGSYKEDPRASGRVLDAIATRTCPRRRLLADDAGIRGGVGRITTVRVQASAWRVRQGRGVRASGRVKRAGAVGRAK